MISTIDDYECDPGFGVWPVSNGSGTSVVSVDTYYLCVVSSESIDVLPLSVWLAVNL